MRTDRPPREPRIVVFLLLGAALGIVAMLLWARVAGGSVSASQPGNGYLVGVGASLGALFGGLVAALISASNTRRR